MTEARAILYTLTGDRFDLTSSEPVPIPNKDYTQAKVIQGKWLFYSAQDNSEGGCHTKIINEGEGKVDIGFTCKSAREAVYHADAIILFEHTGFRGVMKTYTEDAMKLVGFNSGVSSAIVFPTRSWILYEKEGKRGNSHEAEAGKEYSSMAEIGFGNDTVKSIAHDR